MNKIGLLALAILLVPVYAFAVDGQVLLNQSSITAAGGFPFSITQPGSYKLTGNLLVPGGVNGIRIGASNVTLDLNGFTIAAGPAVFAQNTRLVYSTTAISGFILRNGTIFGSLTTNLIDLLSATRISLLDLLLHDEAGGNISFFGASTTIRGVTNPGGSLAIRCPALVVDTLAVNFLRDTSTSTACAFGFVVGSII